MSEPTKHVTFNGHRSDSEDKMAMEAKMKKTVILDVGGERFTAFRNTLGKFPATRLGKLMRASNIEKILEHCDEFVPGDPPEYFFDRNPDNFPSILNMYRTGKFHTTERGCALVLQRDLEYWVIDDMTMEPCCSLKYFPTVEATWLISCPRILCKITRLHFLTLPHFFFYKNLNLLVLCKIK